MTHIERYIKKILSFIGKNIFSISIAVSVLMFGLIFSLNLISPRVPTRTYIFSHDTKTSFPESASRYNYPEQLSFEYPLGEWENYYMFEVLFFCSLGFAFLFIAFQYFYYREIAYLHYAGYVLITFLYFIRRATFVSDSGFIEYYQFGGKFYELENFLSLGVMLSYTYFIRSFLGIQNVSKTFNRITLIAIYMVAIYMLMDIIIGLSINKHSKELEYLSKITLTPLLLYAIFFGLRKSKNPLRKWVIIGSAILFGSTMITWGMHIKNAISHILIPYPSKLFYNKIGILVEVLFFSIGLGYKSKLIKEDREKAITDALEKKQEALAANLALLRSQLNPHFVFNSLNSIKHLIQEGSLEKAERYLIDFSRLFRQTLNFTNEEIITLEDELTFCEDYLKIESLRFDHSFAYEIRVEEDIECSFILIPPISIQPLVENALEHGLLPKKHGELKLEIWVYSDGDIVYCKILDNGIGRKQAKKHGRFNQTSAKKKSYGLKITRERLAACDIDMQIIDKEDVHGGSLGTEIILTFN